MNSDYLGDERKTQRAQKHLSYRLKQQERPSILQAISTLFGRKNPLIQPALPRQNTVWLLDNTAHQRAASESNANGLRDQRVWHAEVVACVFVANGRKDLGKFVASIADLIGLDGEGGIDEETRNRIAHRLQPFLDQIAPARLMTIEIPLPNGPVRRHELGPTNSNGISSQTVSLGHHYIEDGTIVQPSLHGWDRPVSMNTVFAAPEGWLVISDIDDTIKYTQTPEPIGILRTTFAEEPQPIKGMPDLYTYIQQQLVPTWFYLSASPYNLYPFLREFLCRYYCQGTLILRDSSWMDLGGLLQSFTQNTQEYKVDRIEKIHQWFPRRRVLCIGDSTQKDPEAYAEMYKKYPEWIQAILIRKVTDVPHVEDRIAPARFEAAFEGVPGEVWMVFEEADELYGMVDELAMKDTGPT